MQVTDPRWRNSLAGVTTVSTRQWPATLNPTGHPFSVTPRNSIIGMILYHRLNFNRDVRVDNREGGLGKWCGRGRVGWSGMGWFRSGESNTGKQRDFRSDSLSQQEFGTTVVILLTCKRQESMSGVRLDPRPARDTKCRLKILFCNGTDRRPVPAERLHQHPPPSLSLPPLPPLSHPTPWPFSFVEVRPGRQSMKDRTQNGYTVDDEVKTKCFWVDACSMSRAK